MTIHHPRASLPQLIGKMPHRRKQESDFAFMVFDIGHLGANLGHQHNIVIAIEITQTRNLLIELVTKNKAQNGHADSFSAANAASASRRDVFTSTIGRG